MAQRHSKVLILGSGAAAKGRHLYCPSGAGTCPDPRHGREQMTITTDVEIIPALPT